jgi:hypothetical protein
VLEQAAGTDPELAQLLESGKQEQLECARGVVVAAVAATGSLRRDIPHEAAADMLWVQIQPSNYRRLVEERDWSHRAFERWHAAAMIAALLEPSGSCSVPARRPGRCCLRSGAAPARRCSRGRLLRQHSVQLGLVAALAFYDGNTGTFLGWTLSSKTALGSGRSAGACPAVIAPGVFLRRRHGACLPGDRRVRERLTPTT